MLTAKLIPKDESDRVSACLPDCEALRDLTASLVSPDRPPQTDRGIVCLEVGAYVGHTALAMIAGGARHVYCVDLWSGDLDYEQEGWNWRIDRDLGQRVFEQFCRRVPIWDRVTPVVGDSLVEAAHWRLPLDLVFIDANHSYESCRADIAAWTPHVRHGGIICGHDFGECCPGVMHAVRESGPYELAGRSVWWRRSGASDA